MRRLTLLALAGTLVLSACSDQDSQSPTEPTVAPPSATFGSVCSHGRYPFTTVAPLTQDTDIFKSKPLRSEALLRVGAIALLWDTCNDQLARQAALRTLTWIDQNKFKNADEDKVEALKAAILDGFGAGAFQGSFVTGLFIPGDPNTEQVFEASGNDALIALKGDAFDEPTLITVRRLPNDAFLTGFPEEDQRPPFWDYDATNSSTDNTVETHMPAPGTVVIAFCFEPVGETYFEFDAGAQIGHNPVGGGFEFVPEVFDRPDLTNQLDACPPPPPGGGIGSRMGSPDRGLRGFTSFLASAARTLFLPAPLHAAMVGGRGPIAGAPSSLSPFGIVLPDCEAYSDEPFCGSID